VPGDPEQVHPPCPEFDDERDVQAAQRERAIDVEEIGGKQCASVSAQEDPPGPIMARWRRNAVGAQDLPDGGGSHPAPSRRSSPWILTTPRRVFSRARRRISATSSSGTGGRPGGLGWHHFAATRRRCQRSSVPGVTIRRVRSPFGMILVSAASTARSVQDMCGLGFARRSTATSCRSASISTSLDDADRATSASQDSTVTSSR